MAEADAAVAGGLTTELTMLMWRLRVYKFIRKAPVPAKQMPGCACCFAQFVFEGKSLWSQRSTLGGEMWEMQEPLCMLQE